MDSLNLARAIRREALKMVHNAGASHIGSALSIADILAVLYQDILNVSAVSVGDRNRDRFILSKGHACVALYAVLAELGFFEKSLLDEYGRENSILMNHISHKVPGVEFSTGALGHGLPFGVGKALSAKINKEAWRTLVLASDGEMQEGSNWEAIMFAAHHRLDNLTLIIDHNNLQSLTTVVDTLNIQPLRQKLVAFGWEVREVDGHCHFELLEGFRPKMTGAEKPLAVIANTVKGRGVDFMENSVEWHYKSPNEEELASALMQIANA